MDAKIKAQLADLKRRRHTLSADQRAELSAILEACKREKNQARERRIQRYCEVFPGPSGLQEYRAGKMTFRELYSRAVCFADMYVQKHCGIHKPARAGVPAGASRNEFCPACGGALALTRWKLESWVSYRRVCSSAAAYCCVLCGCESIPWSAREAMLSGLCKYMGPEWEVEAVLEEARHMKGRPIQFTVREEMEYSGR
jgi:hypothetical protein